MRIWIAAVALGLSGCEALDGPESASGFFPDLEESLTLDEPTDFTVAVRLTPQANWDLDRVRVFVSVMVFVGAGDAEAAELRVGDHLRRTWRQQGGWWDVLQRGGPVVLSCERRTCDGELPVTVSPHHGTLEEVELQAWVDVRSDLPPHPMDPVAMRVTITPN